FVRKRQLLTLLSKGSLRFFITITLTAGLLQTLFHYAKRPVLRESQKKMFNTLVTSLSMSLGIAIASSFKEVAINIRWWVLSRKKRPLSEVDAILECGSLTGLTFLAVKSTRDRKQKIAVVCAGWVLINIAAQVGVAMIGFTYALNNAYGEMALAWAMGNLTKDAKVTPPTPLSAAGSNPFAYLATPDYFQYFFMESSANSDPNSNNISFYSNRSIKTTGSCITYPVHDNVNGSSQSFTFEKDGETFDRDFQSIGPNSTTYYTQQNMECGPRCKELCAYENNGVAAFYHECNVTVSTVSNVSYPSQNVSDKNALMAAGAIGLQGYQQYSNSRPMSQYQQFPAESTYGHFVGDGAQMASLMSQFAIGVFVTADKIMNPIPAPVSGLLPLQGVCLSVEKPVVVLAILISIVVCHFVLFVLGSLVANTVVVVNDSYLAIALLLRPVTEKMANQGFLVWGERSFPAIENMDVVYRKSMREKERDGIMELEISEC
ncbi:hypothetical protein BGZ57DRAFT_777929, partial [Hyaloscypha finlandica]